MIRVSSEALTTKQRAHIIERWTSKQNLRQRTAWARMASAVEEFSYQAQCLREQIQDDTSCSAAWTPEETLQLLALVNGDKWVQRVKTATNKEPEQCLRYFESMLMESIHPNTEKPAPTSKKPAKVLPRLTERQQLAILLKGEFPQETAQEQPDEQEEWRPVEYEQWSPSKQSLWNAVDTAPDKFFYEYLPPGVAARTGEWSEAEERLFLRQLRLRPPAGLWGLFSLHLEGRTGMECEEFFKTLRSRGKLNASWKSYVIPMDVSSPVSGLFRKPNARAPSEQKLAKRKRLSEASASEAKSSNTRAKQTEARTPAGRKAKPRVSPINTSQDDDIVVKLEKEDGPLAKTPSPLPSASPSRPSLPPPATRSSAAAAAATPSPTSSSKAKTPSPRASKGSSSSSATATPSPQSASKSSSSKAPAIAPARIEVISPPLAVKPARPSIPPFSSASLTEITPPPEFVITDEVGYLERAYQVRSTRLQDVFGRQLDRIRRPQDNNSINFTFLDGCKALSRHPPERDDGVTNIFELPWTREQRARRCLESCHEAQKDVDRMHQLQLQTMLALRKAGLG